MGGAGAERSRGRLGRGTQAWPSICTQHQAFTKAKCRLSHTEPLPRRRPAEGLPAQLTPIPQSPPTHLVLPLRLLQLPRRLPHARHVVAQRHLGRRAGKVGRVGTGGTPEITVVRST